MELTSTAHGSSSYSSVYQFLFLRVMGPSCPSSPVSSANAARHLRGQQVGRQTLMVHTISPTPGIRQVSAPSCATSSPHCPRPLHGFLHSNGGGTISSTSSRPAFQPISCMSIPTAKAHSCGTPVSTGKADIYDKYHFLVSLFCLFCP